MLVEWSGVEGCGDGVERANERDKMRWNGFNSKSVDASTERCGDRMCSCCPRCLGLHYIMFALW